MYERDRGGGGGGRGGGREGGREAGREGDSERESQKLATKRFEPGQQFDHSAKEVCTGGVLCVQV